MSIAHIANGESGSSCRTKLNAVIDIANTSVADPFLGGLILPGTKGSYKNEYLSVANGATVDLLPLTSGAGLVDWMFLGVPYGCTLTIIIDGVTTYSGEVQRFFCAEYADTQTPYAGKWFMFNGSASGLGLATRLPVPFSTSINIQLTNTTGSTKTIFSQITYQTGLTPANWAYGRKLWAASGVNTSVAPNAVLTLLNATGLNPGVLAGIYWHYDGFGGNVTPRTGPLEGNFKIYVDGAGTPSFESPGTEDYFGMSNYFMNFLPVEVETTPLAGFSNNTSDDIGLTIRTNQNPPNTFAAFRMHPRDPVLFTNALNVTWNCGDTSEASFTGNSRIAWCVWYYTQ